MKIVCIVGARPNFMKVAPVLGALRRHGHVAPLVHTGQHYDRKMSEVFFEHLGMPRPDVNLGVGSGSHAVQTARIMEAFEPVVVEGRPDAVLVAGDVNSTIACALVAVKLGVPVAHLEAGLRSRDPSMPEEINRILTDRISAILLTPSADGDENLKAEGAPDACIHRVGNAMIDSVLAHLEQAKATGIHADLGVEAGGYGLLTLHRPSNVDDAAVLGRLLEAVGTLAAEVPILFPVHPRTRGRIETFGLSKRLASRPGLRLVEPLGYLEFLALQAGARLVLTDSGGIQEETTALGVPCLTLRENTERPVTITEGTNVLVGTDPERIVAEGRSILRGEGKDGRIPELWDGRTGERVAELFDRLEQDGFPERR
jgi:UDP-N-acetylglucosamine 2-epimerase (non-hydrolysing)